MKTVEKTITNNTTTTVYIAEDGTEFKNIKDCELYEDSVAFAFKNRMTVCLKPLHSDDNLKIVDILIDDERGESSYYKFEPTSSEDILNFLGYCKSQGLIRPSGSNSWWEGKEFNPFIQFNDLKVGEKYLVCMYLESQCLRIINVEKYTTVFKNLITEVFNSVEMYAN